MFGFSPFSTRPFSALRNNSIIFDIVLDVDISLVFLIYAAEKEFATRPDDTLLASQPFFGTLDAFTFDRTILGSDIIGRFTQGSGEIHLANTDGGYDFLPQSYAIDGRRVIVKVGEEGTDQSTFVTLFHGSGSNDWDVSEDKVTIQVQDDSYRLDIPAQPNTYAGTGSGEGGSDLQGKPKPLALGYVSNISPPLLDANTLLYQVHDGPVQAITVFDQAVPLTFSADYASLTLLLAATVASGHYATCIAAGYFRLNNLVDNSQITADVEGDKTGGIFAATASTMIRRLIDITGALTVDDLYLPGFNAVEADQPAQLGYYLSTDSGTVTVWDVCADIMGSVGGWAGFRRTGKFEIQIFYGPADAPSLSLTTVDDRSVDRSRGPDALSPPPYQWQVGWGKNWTVQNTIAGAATDARRTFVASEYRYATASSATILADHPFSKKRDPIPGYFRNEADALTEASRLLALYRKPKAVYTVATGTEMLSIDLGETVNVTHPRWDLSAGRNLSFVSISIDATTRTCKAGFWG